MSDSKLCTMCKKADKTYVHLFIMCEHVANFWIEVENLIKQYDSEQINFQVDTVLSNFLVTNLGKIANFICLIAKQYICHAGWRMPWSG